jgi:hypothetical protein
MTAHDRERVLLLAGNERDILWRFKLAGLCEMAAVINLGRLPLSALAAVHRGAQPSGLRGCVRPAERSRYLSTATAAVLLFVAAAGDDHGSSILLEGD